MPVLNLTAQFIKGLKAPAKGRIEYWDTSTTLVDYPRAALASSRAGRDIVGKRPG